MCSTELDDDEEGIGDIGLEGTRYPRFGAGRVPSEACSPPYRLYMKRVGHAVHALYVVLDVRSPHDRIHLSTSWPIDPAWKLSAWRALAAKLRTQFPPGGAGRPDPREWGSRSPVGIE